MYEENKVAPIHTTSAEEIYYSDSMMNRPAVVQDESIRKQQWIQNKGD